MSRAKEFGRKAGYAAAGAVVAFGATYGGEIKGFLPVPNHPHESRPILVAPEKQARILNPLTIEKDIVNILPATRIRTGRITGKDVHTTEVLPSDYLDDSSAKTIRTNSGGIAIVISIDNAMLNIYPVDVVKVAYKTGGIGDENSNTFSTELPIETVARLMDAENAGKRFEDHRLTLILTNKPITNNVGEKYDNVIVVPEEIFIDPNPQNPNQGPEVGLFANTLVAQGANMHYKNLLDGSPTYGILFHK